MELSILSPAGQAFFFRWIHILAGITWIGLLYYFNFVQTPFMAEADAATKPGVVRKLVPRALWWFRWAAMLTFLTGWTILLGYKGGHFYMASPEAVKILTGGLLGTLMFLNVWLIIWPNQKIIIASAEAVANGGQADPKAATAAPKAALASRTNTLFSIPMAFFMAASVHLPIQTGPETSLSCYYIPMLILVGLLELNAIKGKMGPMASVKGVVHCGVALAVVLYLMMEFCL